MTPAGTFVVLRPGTGQRFGKGSWDDAMRMLSEARRTLGGEWQAVLESQVKRHGR